MKRGHNHQQLHAAKVMLSYRLFPSASEVKSEWARGDYYLYSWLLLFETALLKYLGLEGAKTVHQYTLLNKNSNQLFSFCCILYAQLTHLP